MTARSGETTPDVLSRPATPADAPALARLIDLAAEGLPHHLWTAMAAPGEDPWAVGARRAARDEGSFSYANATVLVHGNAVIGCLLGYPLPDVPEPFDPGDTPPIFRPLLELEGLAAGSWYVNVLAIEAGWRNLGLGRRLLAHADRLAAETGRQGTSLIVADHNTAARRFYAREGYREIASRRIVKNGWHTAAEHWILCRKD